MTRVVKSMENAFSGVADFRHPQGRRYNLQAVLLLTTLALMHGAETENEVAEWSKKNGERWLRVVGIRRHSIPSRSTIHRIFKGIDSGQLNEALLRLKDRPVLNLNDTSNIYNLQFVEQCDESNRESFELLNEWIDKNRHNLKVSEPGENGVLNGEWIDELTLSISDEDDSHISCSGLKIWGLDLGEKSKYYSQEI